MPSQPPQPARPDGEAAARNGDGSRARLRISLKAGQTIYVNGALLRADRKIAIELLNDAAFLLETHIMTEEEAVTPLHLLYCAVQGLLMVRSPTDQQWAAARAATAALREGKAGDMAASLARVERLLQLGQAFPALREIRSLLGGTEVAAGQPCSDTVPM